jgi:hypothetical protein
MTQWRHFFLIVALALCLVGLVALVATAGPAAAQSTTRYVSTSGVDSGVCTDPASPCRTVQYAVDASASGDVILVATGVYTDVHPRPPSPEDPYPPPGGVVTQVVYITHSLTILGGYLAPDFGPPDPSAQPSTLDAGDQGRVIYAVGAISLTLERLVVAGGQVGDRNLEPGYGGGLYLVSAAATISGCAIGDNEAIPLGPDVPEQGGQGGGLYAHNVDLSIGHSQVNGNHAWHGAGLYVDGGTATLFDDDVQSNGAYGWSYGCDYPMSFGGGMYLAGVATSLTGSTVTGNWAEGDGGGLYIVGGRAALDGNTVAGNTASHGDSCHGAYGDGGGLWVGSSQVTLLGNTVSGNSSLYSGGGLHVEGSDAVLTDNQVTNNYIGGSYYWQLGGGGSALYLGGTHAVLARNVVRLNTTSAGVCSTICLSGSNVRAENMIVTDNAMTYEPMSGRDRGAIDVRGSVATFTHLTLARNTSPQGIGLSVYGSDVTLNNTILVSHTLGIDVSGGSTVLEATLWGAGPWANGTDWQDDGSLVTGTINLWGDPAFVDPGAGDYHLGLGSAAINRGVDAGVTDDIDGEPRPDWCAYDIGADELQTGNPCWRMILPLVPRRAVWAFGAKR